MYVWDGQVPLHPACSSVDNTGMWLRTVRPRGFGRCVFALVCVVGSGCGGTLSLKSDVKIDPRADKLAARAAVLKQSDLPGFTANRAEESSGFSAEDEKLLAKCLKSDVEVLEAPESAQSATSPGFERGTLEIGSEVWIDRDASAIDEVFDVLTGGRFEECLSFLMASNIAKEPAPTIEFGAPTFVRQTSQLGDRGARFMGEVEVTSRGVTGHLYLEILFVKEGRAVIALAANDGEPIDTALCDRLMKAMLRRLDGHT
jgi:hypothetical protein